MNRYIKIWDSIEESPVYAHPSHLKIWIHIVLRANLRPRHANVKAGTGYTQVKVERGQLIASRASIAERVGLDENFVYRTLEKFVNWQMIELNVVNNQFTLITICNYDTYNSVKPESEQPVNSHRTGNEQALNSHRTAGERPLNTLYDSYDSNDSTKEMSVHNAHEGAREPETHKPEPPRPEPRPERPDLPSYNPNGPRPPGWTDFDEQKLITGQEAKRAIKEALHVHNGGSVNGWKRIEAGCREWKALYQARDHYDRLEMPYSRCLDRVKAEYPDVDPIEKLKAITQAYVNDCQIHNRIKLSALNFIDGDRWKDDWSQTETESTANQGLCPDGSTWTRRPDGRYEVASKSGRKALMAEGWKP